ncbi:hypothetical protein HLY00_4409 [Mycolicibacterium hippocampi]|uniref:Uncharacterized protein n=2 Tax=Mycobacteriaceae TaxID=1762 RepID=A0A850PXF7_9MYCO|nr:hypothetical protein [Mycolicibacterium hippocampi]NVN52700.1 hypothetical protein [Mycolicibacterium hippocampi]
MVGGRARFSVALLVMSALAGCQAQQPAAEPVGTAPPPPVVRHDVAPLAQTFPALGAPVAASWISWRNNDESSRLKLEWLDAVVQIAPEAMDSLVAEHDAEESGQQPAVQKVLEPDLPPGPFLTGVELNMTFGAERRSTRVFLDPPRDMVVLQSSIAG